MKKITLFLFLMVLIISKSEDSKKLKERDFNKFGYHQIENFWGNVKDWKLDCEKLKCHITFLYKGFIDPTGEITSTFSKEVTLKDENEKVKIMKKLKNGIKVQRGIVVVTLDISYDGLFYADYSGYYTKNLIYRNNNTNFWAVLNELLKTDKVSDIEERMKKEYENKVKRNEFKENK